MAERFRTIVADPPWRYGSVGATKANAEHHYGTMPTQDICALDIPAEDDAHLWLWGLNGMMEDAYQVVRAWGFRPINLVTWCKKQPGVGHYMRTNTEQCIFVWPRAEHSKKPDAFYDLVEKVSPGPYLELFARRARMGDWHYWGDESLGTAELHENLSSAA